MLPIKQIISFAEDFELHTERLKLRRFKSSDLGEEIKQQQDPEVVRYIREPMSNEAAVAYFEQFIQPYKGEENEWLGICVERLDDNANIGAISFRIESIESSTFEIGYRFTPKFQGKGYAFEAVNAMVDYLFKSAHAHKVIAYCDTQNTASYKLMEKLSMQREGTLREQIKIAEQWRDTYVYGVLESER